MIELYFKDAVTTSTTVLVIGLILFAGALILKRNQVEKWGKFILIFIVFGTAASGLSAARDLYMTSDALFTVNSFQSTMCSILGGLIFLSGLISLFLKNQKAKRCAFYLISSFFVFKVLTIEISRLIQMG
jgi:uncharacterized membrane protein YgdD (TMEM256/DUF423 family)